MILSFHPLIEADHWILCAGREPDSGDLAAIRRADAVILPQGCRRSLWEMAIQHCRHVFPDYHARFAYPGKTGQIQLFRQTDTPHPESYVYESVRDFYANHPHCKRAAPMSFPFVCKLNWGGEGDAVMLVTDIEALGNVLSKALAAEKSGIKGFIIQRHVAANNRTLRVVIIGSKKISYWRVHEPCGFYGNLAKGAALDTRSDLGLQHAGAAEVDVFCRKTGINLAGVDLLMPESRLNGKPTGPFFLEINYFFGRRGIGGASAFYKMLFAEINSWLKTRGLKTISK